MRVIVAGCGRVGAALAGSLHDRGHDVAIIDRDPDAFRRLPEGYGGRRLTGIVFDRDTLEEAGVAEADAVVAVTSGDNSNIVVARTARERYGVADVIARIYDPVRAAIYERLGVVTVASARWTVEEIERGLLPSSEAVEAALGTGAGDVVLLAVPLPDGAAGLPASEVEEPGRAVLAAITREGRTQVPDRDELLVAGDTVHLAVARDAAEAARARVAALAGRER